MSFTNQPNTAHVPLAVTVTGQAAAASVTTAADLPTPVMHPTSDPPLLVPPPASLPAAVPVPAVMPATVSATDKEVSSPVPAPAALPAAVPVPPALPAAVPAPAALPAAVPVPAVMPAAVQATDKEASSPVPAPAALPAAVPVPAKESPVQVPAAVPVVTQAYFDAVAWVVEEESLFREQLVSGWCEPSFLEGAKQILCSRSEKVSESIQSQAAWRKYGVQKLVDVPGAFRGLFNNHWCVDEDLRGSIGIVSRLVKCLHRTFEDAKLMFCHASGTTKCDNTKRKFFKRVAAACYGGALNRICGCKQAEEPCTDLAPTAAHVWNLFSGEIMLILTCGRCNNHSNTPRMGWFRIATSDLARELDSHPRMYPFSIVGCLSPVQVEWLFPHNVARFVEAAATNLSIYQIVAPPLVRSSLNGFSKEALRLLCINGGRMPDGRVCHVLTSQAWFTLATSCTDAEKKDILRWIDCFLRQGYHHSYGMSYERSTPYTYNAVETTLKTIHYKTLQAICNNGGHFKSHDFTWLLSPQQWRECYSTGNKCLTNMIENVMVKL